MIATASTSVCIRKQRIKMRGTPRGSGDFSEYLFADPSPYERAVSQTHLTIFFALDPTWFLGTLSRSYSWSLLPGAPGRDARTRQAAPSQVAVPVGSGSDLLTRPSSIAAVVVPAASGLPVTSETAAPDDTASSDHGLSGAVASDHAAARGDSYLVPVAGLSQV
jgi:hypothetical protein